jgi:hypothetical protein
MALPIPVGVDEPVTTATLPYSDPMIAFSG